jgi:prepilin-type N-terminal cleavage/methylation domain-containing protein
MSRGRHRQEGYTLVELILSLALMSIVFVAVFAGLASFFSITGSQRSNADLDAVLRRYVEQISAPETPYATCGGSYSSVGLPPPSGSSSYAFASGPTVTYWKGDNPATFDPSCAAYNTNGVQQITATISHTVGNKQQQATVRFTKRNAPTP